MQASRHARILSQLGAHSTHLQLVVVLGALKGGHAVGAHIGLRAGSPRQRSALSATWTIAA